MDVRNFLFQWTIFIIFAAFVCAKKTINTEEDTHLSQSENIDTGEQNEITTLSAKRRTKKLPLSTEAPENGPPHPADVPGIGQIPDGENRNEQPRLSTTAAENFRNEGETTLKTKLSKNRGNKANASNPNADNENTQREKAAESGAERDRSVGVPDHVEAQFPSQVGGSQSEVKRAKQTGRGRSENAENPPNDGENDEIGNERSRQSPSELRKPLRQPSQNREVQRESSNNEESPATTKGFYVLTGVPDDSEFINPTPRSSTNLPKSKNRADPQQEEGDEEEGATKGFYILTGIPDDVEIAETKASRSFVTKNQDDENAEGFHILTRIPKVESTELPEFDTRRPNSASVNYKTTKSDDEIPAEERVENIHRRTTALPNDEESKLVATDADFGKAVNNKFNEIIRNLSANGALTEKDLISERVIKNISDAFAHLIENVLLNRDSSEPLGETEREFILNENAKIIISQFIASRNNHIIMDKRHGTIVDLEDLGTTPSTNGRVTKETSDISSRSEFSRSQNQRTSKETSEATDNTNSGFTSTRINTVQRLSANLSKVDVLPNNKPLQSRTQSQIGVTSEFETSNFEFDVVTHSTKLTNREHSGEPKGIIIQDETEYTSHSISSQKPLVINISDFGREGITRDNLEVTDSNPLNSESSLGFHSEITKQTSHILNTDRVIEATETTESEIIKYGSQNSSETEREKYVEKLINKKSQTPEVKFQLGAVGSTLEPEETENLPFTEDIGNNDKTISRESTQFNSKEVTEKVPTHIITREPLTRPSGRHTSEEVSPNDENLTTEVTVPYSKIFPIVAGQATNTFPQPQDWLDTSDKSGKNPTVSNIFKEHSKPFDSREVTEETTESDYNETETTGLNSNKSSPLDPRFDITGKETSTTSSENFGQEISTSSNGIISKQESTLNFAITAAPIGIVESTNFTDTNENNGTSVLPVVTYTSNSLVFAIQKISNYSTSISNSSETTAAANTGFREVTAGSGKSLSPSQFVTPFESNFSTFDISEVPVDGGVEWNGSNTRLITSGINVISSETSTQPAKEITNFMPGASIGKDEFSSVNSSLPSIISGFEWTKQTEPNAPNGTNDSSVVPESEWTKSTVNSNTSISISGISGIPEPEWTNSSNFSQRPPVPEPQWTKTSDNITPGSQQVTRPTLSNAAIATWAFKFLQLEWDQDYNDKSTWKYQDLQKKVEPDVTKIFQLILKEKFVGLTIKKFASGSVIVNGQTETTEKVDTVQLQEDFRIKVRQMNFIIGGNEIEPSSIKIEGLGDTAPQTDVKAVPASSGGGVPGYAIGIIVAVIILALVLIAAALYLRRYRSRRSEENYMASQNGSNGGTGNTKSWQQQQQQPQQRPQPSNGRDNYAGVNLYEMKDAPGRGGNQAHVNQGYQTDGRTNGYSGTKGETQFQSVDEHAIDFEDEDSSR